MKSYLSGKVAKIAGIALGVAMLASVASPALAQVSTTDLLAQIAALQAQLLAMQGTGSSSVSCNFTTNLSMGMTHAEVKSLQQFLNAKGATVATSGAGAPGMESMYFGSKTKAAVMKWQNMNAASVLVPVGLTSGTGYWGSASRAFANTQCGGVSVTPGTTPTVGGAASVSAGMQPAASLAPQSAARVPFTKFTVTAGASAVTLNSVDVERSGLGQDAVFSGVVLLDDRGIQLGIAKTLNSNHRATVGEAVTIPAGTSKTFTIAGNMASSLASYAGQVVSLSLVGVNTNGTVSGAFPITGAAHTINATLSLGSATLVASAFDPQGAQTKNVGDMGLKFAGVRVTAGSSEDMRLWSIRFNQSGSAGSSDLANLMVNVDGTDYPVTVSSDGKYFTATFGSGIVISKGLAKDVYIKGDIVGAGAANRTVQFDLYKTTDIYLTGETYGYGVVASATGNCQTSATTGSEFVYSSASCAGTASTPWFSGSTITINAGTATTIAKANEVPAQNIAINVPNQVLGGYAVDFKGEPVTVQSTVFSIATTTAGTAYAGLPTSVSIYNENGAVVAGPVDATAGTSPLGTLTFTDSITYPVGRHIYTIKGKVPTTVTNGATYILSSTPSSGWTNVVGQVTGNSISLSSNGAFSMNTMTVKAGNLAVTMSSNPAAQNVVAGAQGVTWANYQLDASQSGEDIRVSNLVTTLTFGSTSNKGDISSCALYDGANQVTTGSNIFNPTDLSTATTSVGAKTFTFDNSITVTKGTIKTLTVKCNVSGSATAGGTYAFGVDTSTVGNITATGVSSSNTITPTGATNAGQNMTVSAVGSLVASTDPSSPGYTIVAAGQTGTTIGVIKFRATNEDININRVGLQLTAASPLVGRTASSSPSDLVMVHLFDGATEIGTATFTGSNLNATSTLATPLLVKRDSDKLITIKADFAPIGMSYSATEGHLVVVDFDGNTNTQGVGAMSGSTINASGSTAMAGARLLKTFPTFALDTLPGSGIADGRLMRFKITANSAGDVGLDKFTLTLATTSATVTGVNIYGFTDAAYSQPISGVNTGGQFMASNVNPNGSGVSIIQPQTSGAASTTVSVPAGQTRYFEIRGTVSGTATTYSVTATLNGDSAYPVGLPTCTTATTPCMLQAAAVSSVAGGSGKFVWSPYATTSVTVNGNDWTNGFGVNGLPQSGIIQTRTN